MRQMGRDSIALATVTMLPAVPPTVPPTAPPTAAAAKGPRTDATVPIQPRPCDLVSGAISRAVMRDAKSVTESESLPIFSEIMEIAGSLFAEKPGKVVGRRPTTRSNCLLNSVKSWVSSERFFSDPLLSDAEPPEGKPEAEAEELGVCTFLRPKSCAPLDESCKGADSLKYMSGFPDNPSFVGTGSAAMVAEW